MMARAVLRPTIKMPMSGMVVRVKTGLVSRVMAKSPKERPAKPVVDGRILRLPLRRAFEPPLISPSGTLQICPEGEGGCAFASKT